MSGTNELPKDCWAPSICAWRGKCRNEPGRECVGGSLQALVVQPESDAPDTVDGPRCPDARDALLDQGMDEPWPMRDVLEKLTEAATILLDEKNYDGHGWELIAECRDRAREILGIPASERSERSGQRGGPTGWGRREMSDMNESGKIMAEKWSHQMGSNPVTRKSEERAPSCVAASCSAESPEESEAVGPPRSAERRTPSESVRFYKDTKERAAELDDWEVIGVASRIVMDLRMTDQENKAAYVQELIDRLAAKDAVASSETRCGRRNAGRHLSEAEEGGDEKR